jgi:type II secretory pathway pseudopilin PulG
VIHNTERSLDREGGFGMIEIVVSMFMLALLAIAFLPVLVQGIRTSESNARLATATQLVNQSIELARSTDFASCAALQNFASTIITEPDGRGGELKVTRQVSCDATNADPERVLVTVTPTLEPANELARAITFVLLSD